ncbi:glycosyltransferase [Pseudomonas kurunegalensis]|uniref:glycosyltransferase n=1 Tax=Pseudomonas kurunegalensis TaxID=485880 RepID=UPI00256FC7E2|nr:glycosyltransferase [Pseudomonas kurunegalensis]WJD61251.1 glycosyltransferase [Pseudomonas kurunegalensis]
MSEQPLVSIAIPAFNADFFQATLVSALSQDYPNLEVVICDDSAGVEIEAICQALGNGAAVPVRYTRNPVRLGFARNLQACLEQANGELVKFLCDDDLLLDSCISRQAHVLTQWPQLSMVIGQRLLWSADDILLPSRALNSVIAPQSAVIVGTDLLASIAENVPNLFGGISHVLFRRAQVLEYLPQLVQGGQGFAARLDLALYACLLRRGHLASLERILSVERIHPGRLSHHSSMTEAYKHETEWLQQMLAARTGESAPANGWVRYLPLEAYDPGADPAWEELDIRRFHAGQVANFSQQVGSNALSFTELYAEWLACRTLSDGQLRLLPKRVEQWPVQPAIVPIVTCREGDESALRATLDCLAAQSYAASQVLVLVPDGFHRVDAPGVQYLALSGSGYAQLNQWLAGARVADWVLLLRAGDRLRPHALVVMAERMALRDESMCLYADEDTFGALEPGNPIFKPDFNLDLMRSVPYVGRTLAFKRTALLALEGFDTRFESLAPQDLLWRMVEAHGLHVVEHVAQMLVHCQSGYAEWMSEPAGQAEAARVVEAHLRRIGVDALVEGTAGSLVTRVTYRHEQQASVSILIPAGSNLNALRRCVESLFQYTEYSHFEALVIANGDEPQAVAEWLAAMRGLGSDQLRVIDVQAQGRAAMLNQASRHAQGEYLLLLAPECALFEPRWLSTLMSQAQRPEVGLVGPALCGSNGELVSSGLVLGLGGGTAGSPFPGKFLSAEGYMGRQQLVQNWSALSLDCLLIRRALFEELEGLDTSAFQVALFDVDLCLRAREKGFLSVGTPFARVMRLPGGEAVELADELAKADRDIAYDRWLSRIARDPAYNDNLSLKFANFNLEPGLRSGWDPFIARAMPSVLALPINTTAVGHYRVIQPFTELERAGWIQGRVNHVSPGVIELEREKPDVMILQCRYMPGNIREMAQFKRFSHARMIYELDDYIIDPPKKNDHARNLPSNLAELVAQGIGQCDRLVCSTEPLADALSSMHKDIRVVPNMLSAALWAGLSSQRQTSIRPRVGWAGGTSHRGDLELLQEVVKILADDVDWVFFGMCPESLRPYVKEFHKGIPMAGYPRKLAGLNLDLALAPLEQNLFNDCKSNLRLLEYGACGFPVVCTDTKAYAGYLPCTRVKDNTTEQWLDAIRMHLAAPQASYRQGDALREAVLRDYMLMPHHLQHWANAWLAD